MALIFGKDFNFFFNVAIVVEEVEEIKFELLSCFLEAGIAQEVTATTALCSTGETLANFGLPKVESTDILSFASLTLTSSFLFFVCFSTVAISTCSIMDALTVEELQLLFGLKPEAVICSSSLSLCFRIRRVCRLFLCYGTIIAISLVFLLKLGHFSMSYDSCSAPVINTSYSYLTLCAHDKSVQKVMTLYKLLMNVNSKYSLNAMVWDVKEDNIRLLEKFGVKTIQVPSEINVRPGYLKPGFDLLETAN
jgi:hypothetical protein